MEGPPTGGRLALMGGDPMAGGQCHPSRAGGQCLGAGGPPPPPTGGANKGGGKTVATGKAGTGRDREWLKQGRPETGRLRPVSSVAPTRADPPGVYTS